MSKTLWYRLERPTGTKEAARLRQRGSLKGTKGGQRHRLKYPVSQTEANGLGLGEPVRKLVPKALSTRY